MLTSIVHSSYAEMRESTKVHELFHRIALEGRSDAEVVMAVSWLAGASVVLEGRNHHVLAFQTRPDDDSEAVLGDWERRSRRSRKMPIPNSTPIKDSTNARMPRNASITSASSLPIRRTG